MKGGTCEDCEYTKTKDNELFCRRWDAFVTFNQTCSSWLKKKGVEEP